MLAFGLRSLLLDGRGCPASSLRGDDANVPGGTGGYVGGISGCSGFEWNCV